MAAIQKIRSYGVVLICIVGLALFAFIAEELVRAISTTRNIGRQVIGEVYGESVNYQDFNTMYEEYENAVKTTGSGQNLTDAQAVQLRDQVWNEYLTQQIIGHEARALGLTVTDAEVQTLINTGSAPILRQTPFVNQQTGSFDANMLKQFIANYDEIMNNPDYPETQKESLEQLMRYWKFIEKQVRQQALVEKFQALMSNCIIANPVNAKAAFEARNTESTVVLAAIPYTTIKDTDVQPGEGEIKDKYNEMKGQYPDMFDMQQESRDIKYIAVPIEASEADREALRKELLEYAQALEDGSATPASVARESRSSCLYNGLPQSKSSLPTDVAAIVDSMAVGSMEGPYESTTDNSMNVVRLIAKTSLPDSVEFRRIDIPGTDEKAAQTVDSIMTALNSGAIMDSIAKTYNQAAALQWVTSAQVDGAQLNEEGRDFILTLFSTPAGTFKKVSVAGGSIILQINDRRNFVDKYDVVVIKRAIDFSDDTHNEVWNKFSSFLAANPDVADIEANASQNGYTVRESQYVGSTSHYIANISGTTDALRWVFDKAKKGDVSELYECGTNNNELLVVMVTDVHKKGPRSINDANLHSLLEQEVIKDKKAARIMENTGSAKSLAEVMKAEGAVRDTVTGITFSAPVFVTRVASSEPVLSGAVAASAKGDFVSGVRGDNAVYAFQVIDTRKRPGEMDAKQEETTLTSSYLRNLNGVMNALVRKAKIVDHRYKFYQ